MADHEQEDSPKKPPKIKLGQTNGNGLPKPKLPSEGIQDAAAAGQPAEDTTRIELGGSSEGLKPPKASLRPKEDTTRIDLPSISGPAPKPLGKSETARLDLSAAKPPKPAVPGSDTARIDLNTAKPSKPDTARIDLSQTHAPGDAPEAASASDTQPVSPVASSSADTARIDIPPDAPPQQSETEALPPSEAPTRGVAQLTEEERQEILKQSTIQADTDGAAAGGSDFSPATSGIPEDDEVEREREEILKQSTMRVELDGIQTSEDPPSAAKNKTMRVELDQEEVRRKSSTARIELPDIDAPDASARIKIEEQSGSDDVFKRHASAGAAPLAGAAAAEVAPQKSKTEKTDLSEPVGPAPDAEAGKSKTARIEMPADAVSAQAGRPKTIKIKRAETPPMRATAAPSAGVKRSKGGKKSAASADASEVGTLYSILAIASVVVIGVLLYVLAAQTVAPSLPFMGKIG